MPPTKRRSTRNPGTDRAAAETRQPTPKRKAGATRSRDEVDRATRARRSPSTGAEQGGEPPAPGGSDEVVDVNLVVLKGRLAADAEHRTYESGARALRLLVTIRLSEPRQRIDVIPVTMWDPSRDLVRKPPVRGDHVWLTGNVQRRFWEAPEGRRSRVEVIAHEIKRVEPDAVTPTG